MPVNITSIKTSSNGAWQGDNPLDYAFPLLIVQITLVLLLTRSLAFVLKPLRQPKVIAEIIGGILLGPSALGRNKTYMHRIFPPWSTPILESVASIGLLFFLFLVGLELDLASIRRSGKRALSIAAAGITLPFLLGIGVAFILRKTIPGAAQVGFSQFLVFMGVALSITAFPVLARILAELKLLTTPIGETAMSAAAFNDVVAWVLLALAVALSGNGTEHKKSPLISIWVLLSGVAFVVIMMSIVRPLMTRIAKRCTQVVDEFYICLTLAGVMASGFVTDLIGVHSIFGAFVFGLTIPKEGDFAERLIERIEDLVSGLLLPLYFASSGLKTNVATISGGEAWGLLVLVIFTACVGKIFGTFFVAVLNRIPVREALTLGLLMNTKGLVELIVLNIGKERKVLNDEIFAILVLMALFTTFMTTPTVMAIYKPARASLSLQKTPPTAQLNQKQLRLLACVLGPANLPSLIRLAESTRTQKLYVMHLLELTERSSSIILTRRARRNGLPFLRRYRRGGDDHPHNSIAVAFQAYARLGRVRVRPMTAISALATMHEDVCHVAEDKGVGMVVLPFEVGPAWRGVNQRVLREAKCDVGVLVDRGLDGGGGGGGEEEEEESPAALARGGVCVVFFGGPDDRVALGLGGRMVGHPEVRVTVVKFVGAERGEVKLRPSLEKSRESSYSFSVAVMDRHKEKELDEKAIEEFRKRWEKTADYVEREASANVVEEVVELGRSGEYELMVVGKGRFPSSTLAGLAERAAVHPELGPMGDALATNNGVVSSVLVIQHYHHILHADEVPVSVVDDGDDQGSSSDSTNKV